ncbi:MAG: hypothetical protein AB3N14_01085, partial [Flavobacteriaceae bacterium]
TLAQKLWDKHELSDAYNFGPSATDGCTVKEVVELSKTAYGVGEVNYAISNTGPHEAGILKLDTTKSRVQLGVVAKWSVPTSILKTIQWYKNLQAGENAYELCLDDIKAYCSEDEEI